MEHNEPLNLSIKKRPIAVVPPSSTKTTIADDGNLPSAVETRCADTFFDHIKPTGGSTIIGPAATVATPPLMWSSLLTASAVAASSALPLSTTEPHRFSAASLLSMIGGSTSSRSSVTQSPPLHIATGSIYMDRTSPAITATAVSSSSPPPPLPQPPRSPPMTSATTKSTTDTFQTQTLSTYFNQQQSLDIAKLHLERYLKLTNQYLQSTAETYMTPNDTINHLIRTNILTNKIAANNLVSIINKLLEQNIMSEYYYKHATTLCQQFQNQSVTRTSTPTPPPQPPVPAAVPSASSPTGSTSSISKRNKGERLSTITKPTTQLTADTFLSSFQAYTASNGFMAAAAAASATTPLRTKSATVTTASSMLPFNLNSQRLYKYNLPQIMIFFAYTMKNNLLNSIFFL